MTALAGAVFASRENGHKMHAMNKLDHVLVVDDEADIRDMLREYLSEYGYVVNVADCGEAMREAVRKQPPDVVLLDVNLPGEDGLALARWLRAEMDVAIIMVSGAGETVDRIVGLEVGADDYVSKPFDPRELLARIKSVARRYRTEPLDREGFRTAGNIDQVSFGGYELNLATHQLTDPDDQEVPLTSMEFDLLKVFVQRPNRVLSRDQLLQLTQNRDWDPYDRSIDIRITRIRRKIETNPNKPKFIKTIRGSGYMFVPNPQ